MNKSPILLFDIGNVFIFAEHRITHKYLVEKYNILLKKALVFYKIKEYIAFSEGKITGYEFAQAIRKAINKPDLTTRQIRHAHDIHLVKPIEKAMNVLNNLYQSKKYQLAFITNTNEWQNGKVDKLVDFSKYSDLIIRSNNEGMTKRNPEIFKRTIKRAGSKNILFVDDNLENIKTAESLGIKSLHVIKNKPNLSSNLKSVGINIDN